MTADWDLGARAWLHDVAYDLAVVAWERYRDLRQTCAVWDGPDIRVDGDTIGVIDFGHTGWHPLVYVVANRSLSPAMHDNDDDRLVAFMRGLETHLALTPAEHEALHLYRLINATVYARWSCWQDRMAIAEGRQPSYQSWLEDLCRFIEHGLPAVGLAVPATSPS